MGVPYSSAEDIIETLQKMGVDFDVKQVSYRNGVHKAAEPQVEGYLQRCLFDDTIDLDTMRANPVTGPYLETCLKDGQWRFEQQVMMFFF